jgi:hypothetical protein
LQVSAEHLQQVTQKALVNVPLVRKVGTATVIINDDVTAQVGHRLANAGKDRYFDLHHTVDVRNR